MISLFLNTASNYLHIAIVVNNQVQDEIYERFDRDLSKMALVKVKELLEKNGIKPDNISNIYVVEGPGSFTGLRVGATIAKTYAWGLSKNLYAMSNLFVMASSVYDYDYVIPLIDARRGYVYAGIYDKNYKSYLDDKYISLKQLQKIVDELDGTYAFVSNDKFEEIDVLPYVPDLDNTWENLTAKKVDCFTFEPNYLKKTEAEEVLENDKKY